MEITYRDFGTNTLHDDAMAVLMKLFKDSPLFDKQEVSNELWIACLEILYFEDFKIDTWCVGCQKESTFTMASFASENLKEELKAWIANSPTYKCPHEVDPHDVERDLHWMLFTCARSNYHKITYVCVQKYKYFKETDVSEAKTVRSILKIGQDPSPADIAIAEARKYSKELDSDYFKEFNRAIGLASHNVGIGSFVYLRRIIEKLVVQAGQENLETEAFADFSDQRFRDKIQTVKQWLPDFLTSNKHLYSILSKAIHELEEKECLAAFEPCKTAIEIILDEHIAKNEADKKKATLEGTLKKLNEELQ